MHPRVAILIASVGLLLCSIGLVPLLGSLDTGSSDQSTRLWLMAMCLMTAGVAFILAPGFAFIRMKWRGHNRDQRIAWNCCPSCGYSLAGIGRRPCPECGCDWCKEDTRNPSS